MSELEPITREELLLNSIAGEGSSEIEPITRQEHYLSAIAGESDLPEGMEPITREEIYYQKILDNGGAGGGGEATGTKNISITANGVTTHNVKAYASAQITTNVPNPSTGTKQITANGTHDVTDYASAEVNVPNSYESSDEGKVVSNGELTAQTSRQVTANGTYDTTLNSSVEVNVPASGITPTGTKNITTNGDHDVTQYATAHVDVPTGITPSGSQTFTQNGTYNVTNLAEAVVNVEGSGGGNNSLYEVVYLEFDNISQGRSVNIPVGDTSFDNYFVEFCLVATGIYEDGLLVMDDVPTLRSTTTSIVFAGTNVMVKEQLSVAGNFINASATETSKTYRPYLSAYSTTNINGGIAGGATTNALTVSGNKLALSTGVNNNARLCIDGYYTKYKFIVHGWNNPVTEVGE